MKKPVGHILAQKESDGYFPCYGAVMSLVMNLVKFRDRSIAWEIMYPILLDQNVTPQSLMFSISRNFLMVLANSLAHNSIFRKTLVMTVATLAAPIIQFSSFLLYCPFVLILCYFWYLCWKIP